jgi:hypothetical protein
VVPGLTVIVEPPPVVPKATAGFWVSRLPRSGVVSQTSALVAAKEAVPAATT